MDRGTPLRPTGRNGKRTGSWARWYRSLAREASCVYVRVACRLTYGKRFVETAAHSVGGHYPIYSDIYWTTDRIFGDAATSEFHVAAVRRGIRRAGAPVARERTLDF